MADDDLMPAIKIDRVRGLHEPDFQCGERHAKGKFTEWTHDDRLRQPVFLGIREDKNAREVYSREGKLSNSSRASAAILAEVVHGGHSEGARRPEFAVEALAKSGRVTAGPPCERLQAICRKSFTLRHAPRWNQTKNASD
jgi:bifunctional non-homologous end joining protein LigD